MQRSQFAFVCMYVCMYIRHTLIAWAQFLWSRPQTTIATWYWFDQEAIDDHACARAVMEQELYYTVLVRPGGDRRVEKIVQEPK